MVRHVKIRFLPVPFGSWLLVFKNILNISPQGLYTVVHLDLVLFVDGWCWYAVCKAKVPRVHLNCMLIKKSKIYAWKAVGVVISTKTLY